MATAKEILELIKRFIFKLHFLVGLAMFLFVAMIAVESDRTVRILLLLPVVLLYILSKVLQAADQAEMVGEMMEHYKKSVTSGKLSTGRATSQTASSSQHKP